MKDTGQHPTAAALSSTGSAAPADEAATEDGTFGFPYIPYPSQLLFMAAVWRALQGSSQKTKFAALELPTGGGKTLSFLCPSVVWLKQQAEQLLLQQLQQKQHQAQVQQKQQQDSEPTRKKPAWVKTALLQQHRQQVQHFLRERRKRLKEAAARAHVAITAAAAAAADPVHQLEQQQGRDCKLPVGSKRHAATNSLLKQQEHAEYDAFAPEERGASLDLEGTGPRHEAWTLSSQQGSPCSLRNPQIVICSRTHQQLQQYVGEIRLMHKRGRRKEIKDFVAVVAAGRQQLCLHPDVCDGSGSSSSNGSSDMADKCSYLVSKGMCSYYKRKHLVADAAVAAPLDIEDLRRVGKSVGGCPYYGCRTAVTEADVVLLPFSLAFSADINTAESTAVSLAGSIFCVDEAHHLSAALSSSKSAALSHQTAASAARVLSLYVEHFKDRLTSRSLHLLQQLSRLVETIYKRLQPFCCCSQQQQSTRQQQEQHHHAVEDLFVSPIGAPAHSPAAGTADTTTAAIAANSADVSARDEETVLTATALLRLFKLENFDLHELIAFLSDPSRRICQKVRGFAMNYNDRLQQPQQKQQQTKTLHMQKQIDQQHYTENYILEPSCLYAVKSFLCALLGMDAADRLSITNVHEHPTAALPAVGPAGNGDRKAADEMETKHIALSTCCCCRLEVVCLATEKAFEPILKASRLVVLMGGTLSPFESLSRFVRCLPPTSYLFLSADCGAARDRVLALPIRRLSSTCSDFCFEFSQRMHFPTQFVSLLRLLLCVSGSVSGGVVVFFPSFATLQSFLAVAGISGGGDGVAVAESIVEELKRRGPIFAERRTPGPTIAEAGIHIAYGTALWQLYSCAVLGGDSAGGMRRATSIMCTRNLDLACNNRSKRGFQWEDKTCKALSAQESSPQSKTAFLFCVMGGRLSEGVNFSNALARLLVVVGMPFPSVKDKIFILHKEHYNAIMTNPKATADEAEEAKPAPSDWPADAKQLQQQQREQHFVDYGLLQCMITVNQTIGRAIRHSKDYAAILLVDRRYSLARVQQMLPRWLLPSLDTTRRVDYGAEDDVEGIARRLQLFFAPLERSEQGSEPERISA